jgi:hypothetical protein
MCFAGKGKAELVYRIDMVEYLDKEFDGKAEKRRREYSWRGEELRFVSLMAREKEYEVRLTFSGIGVRKTRDHCPTVPVGSTLRR